MGILVLVGTVVTGGKGVMKLSSLGEMVVDVGSIATLRSTPEVSLLLE